MEQQLTGVLIGGAIGIIGGLASTLVVMKVRQAQQRRAVCRLAVAEMTAIRDKCQRYLDGKSDLDQFQASTPLWSSLAGQAGHMTREQTIAVRRAVTLDMEARQSGDERKVRDCLASVDQALRLLS